MFCPTPAIVFLFFLLSSCFILSCFCCFFLGLLFIFLFHLVFVKPLKHTFWPKNGLAKHVIGLNPKPRTLRSKFWVYFFLSPAPVTQARRALHTTFLGLLGLRWASLGIFFGLDCLTISRLSSYVKNHFRGLSRVGPLFLFFVLSIFSSSSFFPVFFFFFSSFSFFFFLLFYFFTFFSSFFFFRFSFFFFYFFFFLFFFFSFFLSFFSFFLFSFFLFFFFLFHFFLFSFLFFSFFLAFLFF